jgi:hypothetical protein
VPVLKLGSGERVDERDQEVILVADALHLLVGGEDLALVQAQALGDVLVGVGVDRLLEGLAQQVLAALGRGDVAVGAQHDVVGGERIGRHEEAEVALHDQPLVIGQPLRVLPQGDVAVHVHFLRHPVVGAAGEVLLPGPLVLERNQLVHVRLRVDDALVFGADAGVGGGHHRRLALSVSRGRGGFLRRLYPPGRRGVQQLQAGRGNDVIFKAKHLFFLFPGV